MFPNRKNTPDICRVCLENSTKLYPLKGPIPNVDVYVSTMITYCTSIEIDFDDDLPHGVCLPCFRTVRIAYNFINEFKETNKQLLEGRDGNSHENVHNNQEVEEPSRDVQLNYHHEDNVSNTCENNVQLIKCQEDMQLIKCGKDMQVNKCVNVPLNECQEDVHLNNDGIHNHLDNSVISQSHCFHSEENIMKYSNDNNSNSLNTHVDILFKNEENECDNGKTILNTERNSVLPNQSITLNRHICPFCSLPFLSFHKGLIKHLRNFHQGDSVKCAKCYLDTELTVELYIQHYIEAHFYHCPVCDKKFRGNRSFYNHVKSHSKNVLYQCPNCKKSFRTRLKLRKHMTTHSEIAKYICSKCGKKFKSYDTFWYHKKSHDGIRNHLCNVCGRAFMQSIHLKYHMWHHTGMKQFHCEKCSKSYTSVTQLKKHRLKNCKTVTDKINIES